MRKLLIAFAVLLVLAGGLWYAAHNLNRYLEENRDWLAEQASTALGRPVAFDEIGVSLRGGLGARVTSVAIGDDPAFGKEDFLRAERIHAVIRILPALRGRYEVSRIELDAPAIRIIKTRQGFNFDSIARGSKPEEPAPGPKAIPFVVSALRIRDGVIVFEDRTASPPSELRVEQLAFSANDVSLDRAIELELAAAILGAREPNLRAAGTLGPLGSAADAARAPVDLRVDFGPFVIDRLKQLALVGASVPRELGSPDPIALGVTLSGTRDALATRVSMDASDAAVSYGDQFRKPKGVRFALDAEVERSAEAIEFDKLELELARARLTGSGRIGLAPDMPIDLQLSGSDVPLDGWGDLFPAAAAVDTSGALDLQLRAKGPARGGRVPRIEGTFALQELSARKPGGDLEIEGLTTTLSLKGDRAELPPTDFRLNGNPVRVAASVKQLSNFDTDFSVSSPAFDIAALGAGGKGVEQREVIEGLELRGNARLASGGPQLAATLHSSAGSVRDIAYRTLDAEASFRDRKLRFDKLALLAFDGSITGSGSCDLANPDVPAFSFRGRVDGVDLAALGARLGAARALPLSGRLVANADLTGAGADWPSIRRALVGNGGLEVKEGILGGVNIAESVLGGLTGLPGLSQLISPKVRGKYPALFGMEDTAFDVLSGKVALQGGEALIEQLALGARDYRLDGSGTIALDNALDIGMTLIASPGLTEDLIGGVKQLKLLSDSAGRIRLPLRLGGTLPTIRALPDLQFVARELSTGLVQSGIEKGIEA
ncbi:MAG TPA: AsmA-like C-terminal region-containing protein, partial [Myxococcota bacterium]|nr:AsmA-like C-terminal region-containing protein [Myxococcota bacterium]